MYYENGKIQQEGTYQSGKQEGELIKYYENGQIKEKHNYNFEYYLYKSISYMMIMNHR